jgi:integrase
VKKAEELRSGGATEPVSSSAESLTIRDVALYYLRRTPGFPDRLLEGTWQQIREWYESLSEEVRDTSTVPAFNSVWSDVYTFKRITRDPRFAWSRRILDLEPADATGYFNDYVARGRSKRTGSNDMDRLSTAIRYVIQQHRRTVGLQFNPIEGRKVDREKADIERYTTEEGKRMREAAPLLAARGRWQVLVAAGAVTSGRRIGAVVSLTADDHDFEKGTVLFRAEVAKGENYGRGDEPRPMSAIHRAAALWAIQHHPNPGGPGAPLIWQSRNPKRPVPQPTLWKQLIALEKLAGVEHKDGRGWHSFRRWAATFLADAIGDGPASEFIGMTPETLRRYRYKKVVAETMEQARTALDAELAEGVA